MTSFSQWVKETTKSAIDLGIIPMFDDIPNQQGTLRALRFASHDSQEWYLNCDGQILAINKQGEVYVTIVEEAVALGLGRQLLNAIADRLAR